MKKQAANNGGREQLLKIEEAAGRLGIAPITLRKWLVLRKLAFVKVGACTRIQESEIARIIAEGTVPANVA